MYTTQFDAVAFQLCVDIHVMWPLLTDGDIVGDNFTTIGITGAITLFFIIIATIGVVLLIIIVCRKKRVKKDFVEHTYDIPEPLSTEHAKCDIPLKEAQKEEMHQYNVADSGFPISEIQKEKMQPNVAYGVCRV